MDDWHWEGFARIDYKCQLKAETGFLEWSNRVARSGLAVSSPIHCKEQFVGRMGHVYSIRKESEAIATYRMTFHSSFILKQG